MPTSLHVGRVAASDRRSSYRLPLSDGAATIDLPGSPGLPLADLSADGGRLILPHEERPAGERLPGVLRLGQGFSAGVDLEIVRRLPDGPHGATYGARFTGLSRKASHDLSRFMIDGHTRLQRRLSRLSAEPMPLLRLRRPAHIHGLLRLHGVHRGQTMGVYRGDEPLAAPLRVRSLEAKGNQVSVACGASPHLVEGQAYSFLLPASGAALLFEATVLHRQNGSAGLSLPEEMLQGGFRDSVRLPTWNRDSVDVSFSFPRSDGRRVQRRSLDVSERGLSVPFRSGRDILFPGERLDDLRVDLPTGPVRALGIVRAIAPRGLGDDTVCGIELTDFETRGDRERWLRHVFSLAHPRTDDLDAGLASLAWEVLDSSDYLGLWTRPEDRARLEREFLSSWDSPHQIPGHLIVLREEERKVGTFATSRVYPKTWLLHSLGVDQQERRKRRFFLDVARELYAAMLTLLKGEAAPYFVLFVEKGKRWTDLLYYGFVESLPPESSSLYDEYDLYKCIPGAAAPRPELPRGWRVGAADTRELRAVAAKLRETLTPLELDAYAYGEEVLDLPSFAREAPTRFRREVFVAHDGREPRAALIAECGSDGVNVFGLLNVCRSFSFAPFDDPEEERAVARGLLAAAGEFYRSRGVDEYNVFATSPVTAEAAEEAGRFVAHGVRWLASCDLLPAWLSYVDDVLQVRRLDVKSEG